MNFIIAIVVMLVLGGCATSPEYSDYLKAQTQANTSYVQKPLLVLEGYDGQPITGLKRVEVNVPGQAPVIQQAAPNAWIPVLSQGLSVFGAVGGIMAGGKAAVGLVNATGNAAGQGYKYIQAPAPAAAAIVPQANITTTTTLSGTGTLGSGSYTANGSGLIGSGTQNSNAGTGAAGGNYTPTDNHTISASQNPTTTTAPHGSCTTGTC